MNIRKRDIYMCLITTMLGAIAIGCVLANLFK
jgi:hypothetical protein